MLLKTDAANSISSVYVCVYLYFVFLAFLNTFNRKDTYHQLIFELYQSQKLQIIDQMNKKSKLTIRQVHPMLAKNLFKVYVLVFFIQKCQIIFKNAKNASSTFQKC